MPTTDIFWNQMGLYNEATFSVQIIMVAIAAILTYFIFAKSGTKTNILMKVFLSFAFAWNGIVFFLIYAKSSISTFFAAPLFIIVAILFVVDIFTKKIEFRLPSIKWQKFITAFWILLAFLYPLIGLTLGHFYPKVCMPLAPCPLTVLAIALVTAAIPNVEKKVYVLLLP